MEGIILCGQPGRSFEVGKATGFLAPAGLFLASKFAANSVVQDISKSFMFLAFPLAHHNFFHFCAKGPRFATMPTAHTRFVAWLYHVRVRLLLESSGLVLRDQMVYFSPKFLTNVLSLQVISLHAPTFPAGYWISAFLSCEWLVNRPGFCCCSFIFPPWLTEPYFLNLLSEIPDSPES